MSTLVNHSLSLQSSGHLRPFDARRDLSGVADLVELCFADTLDESGRGYVRRMRMAAKSRDLFGWSTISMNGYIWEQDGKVVGNVTLIPFTARGQRNFLIANVAVHPDFRRRNIARSLTNQSIEHARRNGMRSVWLHVREENDIAVALYESQGFTERLRRSSWLSNSDLPVAEKVEGVRLGTARGRDWELQRRWLAGNYPPEVSWQSSMNLDAFRPGFLGSVYRFIYSLFTLQWSAWVGDRLAASVSWQASLGSAHSLWLASPPEVNEEVLRLLLLHARRQAPSTRQLEFDFPAGQSKKAISEAGFVAHQTLIWMELPL